MGTARRMAANRRNALRSTGPRTAAGKAVVSLNPLRHGLRSSAPVLPDVERPEDWERHRNAVLTALRPVGYLEQTLAYRVALAAWRLHRVARAEIAGAALAQEGALGASAADGYGDPALFREAAEREPDLMERRMLQIRADLAERALQSRQGVRLLPDAGVLEKIVRYEAHLERGLFRALAELRLLQATRHQAASRRPADPLVVGGDGGFARQ